MQFTNADKHTVTLLVMSFFRNGGPREGPQRYSYTLNVINSLGYDASQIDDDTLLSIVRAARWRTLEIEKHQQEAA